mgnify:CR=1 FL=1
MPSGFEHVGAGGPMRPPSLLRLPLMPSGFEHLARHMRSDADLLRLPLMPSGFEHKSRALDLERVTG